MVFVTGIVVGHEGVQSLHATLVPAMFAADELLVGNRDVVLDLLVILDHSLLLVTLDDELVPLVHHQDQLLQQASEGYYIFQGVYTYDTLYVRYCV
jgi:hypothetical protein